MAQGDILFSKLSESAQGEAIALPGTSQIGRTKVHEAAAGTASTDFVTLYAHNTDTTAVQQVSIQFVDNTTDDNELHQKDVIVPAGEEILLYESLPMEDGATLHGWSSLGTVDVSGRIKTQEN